MSAAIVHTSLALLRPQSYGRSLKQKSPVLNKTATHLQKLSTEIFLLLNSKDFTTSPLLDHLSETCLSEFDGQVSATTRDEHVSLLQAVVATYPDLRIQIQGADVYFYGRRHHRATVWVFARVTNYPHHGLWKDSVKILMWQWLPREECGDVLREKNGKGTEEGRWVCVKYVGFRGIVPMDGLSEPLSGSSPSASSSSADSP